VNIHEEEAEMHETVTKADKYVLDRKCGYHDHHDRTRNELLGDKLTSFYAFAGHTLYVWRLHEIVQR